MARGVSDVSGLRNIRSMHSTGKRAIPRAASSAYLDLYMLRKENERLEKEDAILEKRKVGIQKRLEDIKKEMEVLEKLEQQGKGRKDKNREVKKEEPQEKKWKKMGLSY
ncbi:MAG: hypothetical protein AABZ25_09170 [Nitrospirota bacterium]